MNRVTVAVLGLFIAILLGSGILAYVLREEPGTARSTTPVATASPTPGDANQSAREIPLFGQLFGPDASGLSPSNVSTWEAASARILLRFSLAAFLAAILAFRPRRGVSVTRRNPYVAQTQILMAVVAGAMMMVVGDSAARAFGILQRRRWCASARIFAIRKRRPCCSSVLEWGSRRALDAGTWP